MSDQSTRSFGRWGEDRAARRMRSADFEIVDRNWRSPIREIPGEIDVIARRGSLLVFCEVKTRRSGAFGGGAPAVDERKQAKLRALAEIWLRQHPDETGDVRFDVIAVDGAGINWYEAAF